MVSGRLTNLVTGSPVRKATVELAKVGGEVFKATALSDSNGSFSISGIPAGTYRLTIRRNGFLPVAYGAKGPNRPGKSLTVSSGQHLEGINVGLEPPGVISGRILDEDAEPVPGVMVQALAEEGRGLTRYTPAGSAVSNDVGEYRLFGLLPGTYLLASGQMPVGGSSGDLVYPSTFYPSTPDFHSAATLNLGSSAEARDIDLHLFKVRTAAVRGSVVNLPAGMERAVQIQVMRSDRAGINFGSRSAGGFNANTGQFEFVGLTPGSWTLFAWALNDGRFVYAREEIEAGGADINDLRLAMVNGMEVSGTLHFSGGDPPPTLALCRISMTRDVPWGPQPNATVKPDLTFRIPNLSPDSWTLGVAPLPGGGYLASVRYGDQDAMSQPVAIRSASDIHPLSVVIGLDGGTLEGTVRTTATNPAAVESATVLLIPDRAHLAIPGYLKASVSDQAGHYRMSGIAPGKYRLLAMTDVESMAWQKPRFVESLDGKGQELTVAPRASLTKDLVPQE